MSIQPNRMFIPTSNTTVLAAALILTSSLMYILLWCRLEQKRRYFSTWANSSSQNLESRRCKDDKSSDLGYATSFPPFQRAVLQTVSAKMSAYHRGELQVNAIDERRLADSLLGFDEDYRTTSSSRYVFSGFAVGEICSLGDFPDYAALSGVRLPKPYEQFSIETSLPRPYRPFRWSYHQTMSLSKMDADYWIELESTYKSRIAERRRLFTQHGADVLQSLPGSELACKELMEMAIQFLCARYPQYFNLSAGNCLLENKILGTTTPLKTTAPLDILLENIPEDFAIMLRNPTDGRYYLRAGVICSAIGWTLGSKIGLSLPNIHRVVPDYKEKMQLSMDRFFTKMPSSKPIQRGSWFFEVDQPLFMPPNDPREAKLRCQDRHLEAKNIHLRNDWQTLRRLPLSGAIVFNFKALFTPITEFRDEPFIPSLVLKLLNDTKDNILSYKHTWHIEHVVKPLMASYEREQIARGVVPEDWEHQTLDESPFFPGWEEKWHRQQGF